MSLATRSGGKAASKSDESSKSGILIALLLVAFVLPFYFFLGGFRLSGYRLYLLIFFIPIMLRWLRGLAGPICLPDILLIVSPLWMALALFYNHGIAMQWEFAGILFVETVAPYFAARVLIRDMSTFRTFVWWYFAVIIVLLPFAMIESITGKKLILDFFRGIFNVYNSANQAPRLGLNRAQVSMPHPILFGVFCAPAFALAWYVLGNAQARFKQAMRSFFVSLAVFFSLSSGAFMAVLFQFFLVLWDEALQKFKNRWVILVVGCGIIYLILELSSNRNAFQIIASELTFSKSSGYNRILIFNNTIDDIFAHPILGIGMGAWTRPNWLRSSVDNFWLIMALRYGLVAFFMLLAAYVIILYKAGRAKLFGDYARARTGYLIAMIAIGLAATTVHMWEATYCLFMFLLGSGVWFGSADDVQLDETEVVNDTEDRRKIRYTRFPQNH